MGDQLPIYVEVVFLDSRAKCRYVDWDVDDTEERKGEHGWNGADES